MEFSAAVKMLARHDQTEVLLNEARGVVMQAFEGVGTQCFDALAGGSSVNPDPSCGAGESLRAAAVAGAQRLYGRDGEIEVDAEAAISVGDPEDFEGCYVQGWLWVARSQMALSDAGCA